MKLLSLTLLGLPGIVAFTSLDTNNVLRLCTNTKTSISISHEPKKYNRSSVLVAAKKITTIDNWILNSRGGVTGVGGTNGEKVTTSQIASNRSLIQEGANIQTISGSKYKLGKQQIGRERTNAGFKGAIRGTSKAKTIILQPVPKKQAPKPFANITPAKKKSNDTTSKITIIDNWVLNSRGGVTGVGGIKGGKVTTSQIATDESLIQEGAMIQTILGSKYKLGKQQIGRKQTKATKKANKTTSLKPVLVNKESSATSRPAKTSNSKTRTTLTPVLDDWTLNRRTEKITGIISSSSNPSSMPDGSLVTTPALATNIAFVEEGFTVFTVDESKYKLGTPKAGRNDGTTKTKIGGPISLSDWYVNSKGIIVGTVKESGYPNVKVGETISTGKILSDRQYIRKGYTVVSSSGKSFYLDRPKKLRANKSSSGTLTMTLGGPITLVDWYVNSKGDVMGTVSAAGIGYPDILLGETISTGTIRSDRTYIRQGFTIVSSVGNLFYLGKPRKAVPSKVKSPPSATSRGPTKKLVSTKKSKMDSSKTEKSLAKKTPLSFLKFWA